MLELLTLDFFRPLVGASFRILAVEGATLVLSEAEPVRLRSGPAPSHVGREPFDLIFLGPLSPLLPQMIYRMETDGVETLEIFIVPIGPRNGQMQYQAIFS